VSSSEEYPSAIATLNRILDEIRTNILLDIKHNGTGEQLNRRNTYLTRVVAEMEFWAASKNSSAFEMVHGLRIQNHVVNSHPRKTYSYKVPNFYHGSVDSESCTQYAWFEREHHTVNCRDLFITVNETFQPESQNLVPEEQFAYSASNEVSIFVIRNSWIRGRFGTVHGNDFYYTPFQCDLHKLPVRPENLFTTSLSLQHYSEVFVISQDFGDQFYHNTIENLPRLALYVDFLKRNPNIRIHYRESSAAKKLMTLYGLDPSRLVAGDVSADIVYLPHGGGCCGYHGCILCLQVMADYFKSFGMSLIKSHYFTISIPYSFIQNSMLPETTNKIDNVNQSVMYPRNIVLLKRSGSKIRYLQNHDEVEEVVRNLTSEYKYTFKLYSDTPLPSLNETLNIFHNAAVVIAPHGAGLSNLVMVPTGADVIEVLNKIDIVLCYHALAYQLGHRWHGMISKTAAPALIVNATDLGEVLRLFLENRKK